MKKSISALAALILAFTISTNGLAVESRSTLIDTHFYQLAISDVTPDKANITWASKYKNNLVLGMTQDTGFEPEVNYLLGALDNKHTVYVVNKTTAENRKLMEVEYPINKGTKFRTLDFVYNSEGSTKTKESIFIAFVSSLKSQECRQLIVQEYPFPKSFNSGDSVAKGQTFYKSPCLPKSSTGDVRLHQSGGRIALIPKSDWATSQQEIYLSVGDFIKLDVNSKNLSNATRALLGSVIRVSKKKVQTVARGLRNPQGLALVKLGGNPALLETEHGPRGGDELNVVSTGKNYGWPSWSYGTAYEPVNPNDKPLYEGDSGRSALPLYSWLPSIAPSQLLQTSGNEFARWWKNSSVSGGQGDVLMSSLGGQSIFRLRIEKGAVRYVERINIGKRIRSFSQAADGELLLGTDEGKLLIIGSNSYWSSTHGKFLQGEKIK